MTARSVVEEDNNVEALSNFLLVSRNSDIALKASYRLQNKA